MHSQEHDRLPGDHAHRERAPCFAQRKRAPVGVSFHRLDARDGALPEEPEHPGPVERRAGREAKLPAVTAVERRATAAQRCRGAAVGGPDRVVEAPDARESGGERDFRHRERGLVDQSPGEVDARGERDRMRRGAELLREQPAQVTGADSEARGERLHPAAVERAAFDEPERAGHRGGCARPGRRSGRGLGTAAPARAETRLLGRRGTGEEAHVARLRERCPAHRAAVDAGGRHGGVEAAVEAPVVGGERAVAGFRIEHARLIHRPVPSRWSFSELALRSDPGRRALARLFHEVFRESTGARIVTRARRAC